MHQCVECDATRGSIELAARVSAILQANSLYIMCRSPNTLYAFSKHTVRMTDIEVQHTVAHRA